MEDKKPYSDYVLNLIQMQSLDLSEYFLTNYLSTVYITIYQENNKTYTFW